MNLPLCYINFFVVTVGEDFFCINIDFSICIIRGIMANCVVMVDRSIIKKSYIKSL